MKKIKIPRLEIDNENIKNIPNILKDNGVNIKIDVNNWAEEYPYTPKVEAFLAYDNEHIFIRYDVEARGLRTMSVGDGNYVHEDSCVEFFMQKERGDAYINLEFNASGICYASHHSSPKESVLFTPEELSQIKRIVSNPYRMVDLDEDAVWNLTVMIPWTVLGYEKGFLPNKFYANLYKCGDKTTIPHFLSWSEIEGCPSPRFHIPEFFGEIELA